MAHREVRGQRGQGDHRLLHPATMTTTMIHTAGLAAGRGRHWSGTFVSGHYNLKPYGLYSEKNN